MLGKTLLAIVVALAVFALLVALRPSQYKIARSVTIAAPQDRVFGLVNDFHKWDQWSPWAALDPQMRTTYTGPADGVGAVYTWSGDKKVGEGRMTITGNAPPSRVQINLEFLKPYESVADTEFRFEPEGGGTKVTWTMTGTSGFFEKAMFIFVNLDKMVGPDFERGLTKLRAVAEKQVTAAGR